MCLFQNSSCKICLGSVYTLNIYIWMGLSTARAKNASVGKRSVVPFTPPPFCYGPSISCSCKQHFRPCSISRSLHWLPTLSMWTSGAPHTKHLGDLCFPALGGNAAEEHTTIQAEAELRVRRRVPLPVKTSPKALGGESHRCGTRLCTKAVQWPPSTLICPDEGEERGLLL